jgi:hypothetical protein
MEYSIDTSVMLEAWRRYYPPDIFPKWWGLFEEAIDNGIVRSSEIILLNDLSKKDDDVYAWAKNHKKLFIQIDDKIQIEVSRILSSYPRLVENKKGRSASDPFVIALAKLNNAIVVTCEKTYKQNRQTEYSRCLQ